MEECEYFGQLGDSTGKEKSLRASGYIQSCMLNNLHLSYGQ